MSTSTEPNNQPAEIERDIKRYLRGMLDNNVDLCIMLEQKYGLYGYSPAVVLDSLAEMVKEQP